MKYRAMAKWWAYEMAKRHVGPTSLAEHLGAGWKEDQKPLSEGELKKFEEAYEAELVRDVPEAAGSGDRPMKDDHQRIRRAINCRWRGGHLLLRVGPLPRYPGQKQGAQTCGFI